MPTLVLDPPPRELQELLEHRKRSGLHRLDEVWEGVLHMVPAPSGPHAYVTQQLAVLLDGPARAAGLVPAMGEFNLGESIEDFRVPDGAVHRTIPRSTWFPTAALVVDEVLIVDPAERSVRWLALTDGEYRDVQCSGLIDLGPGELAERIDWP